jgi:tetracycline 7-halogenase / FADH2 O2-dependent halogenase
VLPGDRRAVPRRPDGAALGPDGRLQYSASKTVGDRYRLTAHAAGFIEALYSRGLANTVAVVNALFHRLIEVAWTDGWSTERFEYVDRLQQGLFDVHDDLVYSSYVGFGHYDLWNAVIHVWKATSFMTWVPTQKALSDFRRDGDAAAFDALETGPTPGIPGPAGEDVAALLEFTRTTCQAVESGKLRRPRRPRICGRGCVFRTSCRSR